MDNTALRGQSNTRCVSDQSTVHTQTQTCTYKHKHTHTIVCSLRDWMCLTPSLKGLHKAQSVCSRVAVETTRNVHRTFCQSPFLLQHKRRRSNQLLPPDFCLLRGLFQCKYPSVLPLGEVDAETPDGQICVVLDAIQCHCKRINATVAEKDLVDPNLEQVIADLCGPKNCLTRVGCVR